MKIVNMFGGHSIAVFDPKNARKHAQTQKLMRQGRVKFITPAVFTKDSRTYRIVCTIIDRIKADNDLELLARYQ